MGVEPRPASLGQLQHHMARGFTRHENTGAWFLPFPWMAAEWEETPEWR
jgi:hypothetical protein